MASRYFSIGFNDLSFEKKQELISEIKAELLEQWEQEIKENYPEHPEHKSKSWQEIYCREFDIDCRLWEEEAEAKVFNWDLAIKEQAYKEAEKKCGQAMQRLKLEIEV